MGEGEIIRGALKKAGYEVVNNDEDLLILNICTAKGSESALRRIRKTNKKLVLAGCIDSDLKKVRRARGR